MREMLERRSERTTGILQALEEEAEIVQKSCHSALKDICTKIDSFEDFAKEALDPWDVVPVWKRDRTQFIQPLKRMESNLRQSPQHDVLRDLHESTDHELYLCDAEAAMADKDDEDFYRALDTAIETLEEA